MNNREAQQYLLRRKREAIDPVELGWPQRAGRGRRAKGLSQVQVAQALHVSERTYAALERGTIASPTPDLLDSVARLLRMEDHERSALYVYALGHEPPTPMDPAAGTNVPSAWQKAVRKVTGQPCYINDVAWNILAANDDFIRMFPQTPGKPPRLPEQNLMRWMLLREEAREHHLVDWEERWAKPVAAKLRTTVAAHPGNEDLRLLAQEVSDDPVAGPIYHDPDIAYVQPDGDERPMRDAGFAAPEGAPDLRDLCCDRHAPSQLGNVTMCTAQPDASPGARFFFLVFEPSAGACRGQRSHRRAR
ncbi:MmyB family transcriptional regulator [Streptomyces sp. NPDC054855]